MIKVFLIFFNALIFSFFVYADDSLIQIKQKLERIDRDISDIQKIVFANKKNQSVDESEQTQVSPKLTIFDMRLRDIESELQVINLNYENISFEIEDLKETLEKLSFELNDAILAINTKITNNTNIDYQENIDSQLSQPEKENILGTLTIKSNNLSDSNNIEKVEAKINFATPEEQFQAAFDNLRSQKFEEAKSDLELFIKAYDSHELAGSANYWLGEIYLLQKQYREAALVFAEAYQKYPNSVKSPDSLYKLAETLIKIEKKEEACNTLSQFILKYPNNKLIEQSKSKLDNLQCS